MCKTCQYFLEACYWHLIEKRFCYDENIALYEVPENEGKYNNSFDNMAFYDSVAVIAGRAIVTIDPLPDKPIVQQPRQLKWKDMNEIDKINEINNYDEPINVQIETTKSDVSLKPDIENKRKSLKDRRLSKSLYLKIDQPKEIPIIRQQSMPKFYLDTPEENQQIASILCSPSSALTSPVPTNSQGFVYDLYSVVHMEKERVQNLNQLVPIHHNKDDKSSRLYQIKEKIKLRRARSNLSIITNLPHSHHI